MKKTILPWRICAAFVLVFYTGCVSSVPQNVRIVTNEPEAQICVNGEEIGSGQGQLIKIKPNSGPLDIRVKHEDYSDYSQLLEPTKQVNMSFKEKAPWVAGGLAATILGILGIVNIVTSANIEDGIPPVPFGGSVLLVTMGAYTMVNVPLNTFKKNAYQDSYSLDLSPNRNYSELGYGRSDGYNKAGFNAAGMDSLGNYYAGPLIDWQKEGIGVYDCADGTCYTGIFSADLPEGIGRYDDGEGGFFVGTWSKGKKDGIGIFIAPDKKQYREIWTAGEKVSSAPAGKIRSEAHPWLFFGEGVRNGWADGRGDAITADLTMRIENGIYTNGNLNTGRIVMPDGTVYKGRFENELLVEGEIFSPDGTYYKGLLRNGEPEGSGYLRCPDGTVYEGNFEQARFSGWGALTLANGDVYEGDFYNGTPHGEGIYMNKSENMVEKCEFYEGRRIDQAYQIRIAQAKAAEEARLKEEEALIAAEEKKRQEQERQKRLEEQRRAEANNKAWIAGIGGFAAGMYGSSLGMDAGEAAKFGTSVFQDIYEGTDGEHMKAAGDEIIANRKTMAEYEQKYGASDLSNTVSYSDSLQNLPQADHQAESILDNATSRQTLTMGASNTGSDNSRMPSQDYTLPEPFTITINDSHELKIPASSLDENKYSREYQIQGKHLSVRYEYTDTKWLPEGQGSWVIPHTELLFKSDDGHRYKIEVDEGHSQFINCEVHHPYDNATARQQGDWSWSGILINAIDGRKGYSYTLDLEVSPIK